MANKPFDPTNFTALYSLDLGDVLSLDGRAHPLTGTSPVYSVTLPTAGPGAPVQVGGPAGSNQPGSLAADVNANGGLIHWPSLPPHFGARVVVAIIGIILLGVVAFRLAK